MPLDLLTKTPVPDVLPAEMEKIINEIKQCLNKEECLKKVHQILITKYHGNRVKTYTKLPDAFIPDIHKLWNKNGFLHCTNINYVARTLLVKSGHFKEEDIRLKWTLLWYFSPHQYAQVQISEKWIDIDIWAHAYGIEYGNHAKGFN